MPVEYICSAINGLLLLMYAPWYILIAGVGLCAYNVRSYLRREYKVYFITKKEYSGKLFAKMENQFKYKSVCYGVLTAATLVVMILALIDFMTLMI